VLTTSHEARLCCIYTSILFSSRLLATYMQRPRVWSHAPTLFNCDFQHNGITWITHIHTFFAKSFVCSFRVQVFSCLVTHYATSTPKHRVASQLVEVSRPPFELSINKCVVCLNIKCVWAEMCIHMKHAHREQVTHILYGLRMVM
jgi:hypothetical protein